MEVYIEVYGALFFYSECCVAESRNHVEVRGPQTRQQFPGLHELFQIQYHLRKPSFARRKLTKRIYTTYLWYQHVALTSTWPLWRHSRGAKICLAFAEAPRRLHRFASLLGIMGRRGHVCGPRISYGSHSFAGSWAAHGRKRNYRQSRCKCGRGHILRVRLGSATEWGR